MEVFYSADGLIWYWGFYSKEEIARLRQLGLKVMRASWRNRQKLR